MNGRWLVSILWVLTIAGTTAPLAISPPPLTQSIWAFAYAAIPTAGAFILLRRPGNRIGWLLLLSGPLAAVGSSAQSLARAGLESGSTWSAYALLVGSVSLMASVFLLPFIPLRFPDGDLPSRRWRLVELLGIAGAVSAVLGSFLLAGDIESMNFPGVENPISFPGSALLGDLLSFGALIWMQAAVAMVASVVVRFRRSRGDERQQLKWLSFAAGWFALWMVLFLTQIIPMSATPYFGIVNALLLATAITIAVLKYRLYDIDVVISKTVVFAGLAAFITAIYVGIVVGVGTLLGAGDEPNLALSIVATAVVAVAFQPVRERLTRLANRLVFGKRATPYEVLSRFSAHLGETVATEQTLQRMARLLADGTGAAHAQVSLAIGGVMVPAASVGQVSDAPAEAHTVDVTHQDETLGALSVTKKRGETLTPADVKLVDDLAAQAGLLLRNVRLTEELKAKIVDLRASRQRLVAAQDAERRRLERDLHDGAQQQIVAMKLKLGIAKTIAAKENAPKTVELVEQLAEQTDQAVAALRELAHGIYPPLLAAEGLTSAISTAARRAPVPVAVDAPGDLGRYGQDIEAAVYFCVLEAVTNAAKYASPTQVTIRLSDTDGQLTFEVTDDGTGFDPDTTPRGHGTTNMTDRLDALGGQLEILSAPGMGTTVSGRLPVAAPSSPVPRG